MCSFERIPDNLWKVSIGSLLLASFLLILGPASIINTLIPCFANVSAATPPVAPDPTIIAS